MKFLISILAVLSTHAFAGVYYDNLWRTNDVVTCFAEGEENVRNENNYVLKVRAWKEKHKAKVKQWVTEEFSEERTGINFTGFLNCEESPEADVIIFHNKNSKVGTVFLGGIHGLALIGPYPGTIKGFT